ncbi:Histidine kinase-, DNA gyrase B-, and HSP90-like ATPase [Paenibacillus catalpae]|uniref:Histidine kinase-, DNA gyrase B-, and HSP90-like ATPase n=1 Tax=Paenibacillus catalpae TaxID=1045775 RepID=A0A1I1WQH7_9BACL|nr:histidine kinase [Paenibacillus catalpae]SFD97289.1 Histidine kinase-, DNA gyrase B-, and HSP90-like ATPase [Paenibacillus catalpae]
MFGKWKYRHKIASIIFIFSLIPMLILGSVLFFNVWNEKVDAILEKNEAQLAGSVAGVDNMLTSNVDKLLFINSNFYINNYLETKTDQNLVGIISFNDYLQSVAGAVKADMSNDSVIIYSLSEDTLNGDYLRRIDSMGSFEPDGGIQLRRDILASDTGSIIWRLATLKGQGSAENRTFIYLYKKLASLRGPLAVTEIRVPFSSIRRYFDVELPTNSTIGFESSIGGGRFPIAGFDTEGEANAAANANAAGSSHQYEIRNSLKSGIGEIVMKIPRSLVFRELKSYLIGAVAMLIGVMVILFLMVEIVSFYLTRKLEVLFRRMNTTVENLLHNENLQFSTTDDEFSRMGSVLHELMVRVRDYYQRINAYETERTVLETQLLQERINPHFLYNTLSTMRWLSGDERIRGVIDSMVRYYRIALNKGSSIITIDQELEMMNEYLKLQRFAYGIDFEFTIRIEEGLGNTPMLKHLLQPVVENAVLHGINGRETGGSIDIRVERKAGPELSSGEVWIKISDNGDGIDPEKLGSILRGETDSMYGGYGMINTRKRIEVYYGKPYDIDVESESGNGTTVTLRIPASA